MFVNMNKRVRDNLIFLVVAGTAFATDPAIVNAKSKEYSPINFTQEFSLDRGEISPISPGAVYFNHDDTCKLLQRDSGWEKEWCRNIEIMIIAHAPGIRSVLIAKPNSEGFVKFDDWDKEDRKEQIDTMWNQLIEVSKEQGEKLGIKITPVRWHVYPTLNREKSFMYYAFLTDWDGTLIINSKASLFDRKGYVPFQITLESSTISENELERLVQITLNSYTPESEQSYSNFTTGDKVAAAGALGVLATLIGVKYGKGAVVGFLALLVLFLKKAWFLLLIPLYFLKGLLFKKKEV